jgi:hypothetical protein
MPFLKRQADQVEAPSQGVKAGDDSAAKQQSVTFKAIFLGIVVSIGGFMFGYVR